MLSSVGWLILVWAVWTAVSLVTAFLIRFTMRGQQETVEAQEEAIGAAIGAAVGARGGEEMPVTPDGTAPESARLPARPPQHLGPPIGAA